MRSVTKPLVGTTTKFSLSLKEPRNKKKPRLSFRITKIDKDIPFMLLMRALGAGSDQQIIERVTQTSIEDLIDKPSGDSEDGIVKFEYNEDWIEDKMNKRLNAEALRENQMIVEVIGSSIDHAADFSQIDAIAMIGQCAYPEI